LIRLTKVPTSPVSFQTKHRKPSLLDALDKGSSALEDVAFVWCYTGKMLPTSLVRRHAHRKKIPLPSGDEWEWIESTYSNGALAAARRHYEGRPLVMWEGKLSDDDHRKLGRVIGLHNSHAVQTIEISRIGNRIVHFVKTTPHTSPFNLKAQRRALVGVLNSGLKMNPAIARAIGSDPVGIVKAHQLTKLYRAGIAAA